MRRLLRDLHARPTCRVAGGAPLRCAQRWRWLAAVAAAVVAFAACVHPTHALSRMQQQVLWNTSIWPILKGSATCANHYGYPTASDDPVDLRGLGLSGWIPTTIGQLTAVQELLLDHNLLHGTLPSEIANIPLRTLSVSHNPLLKTTIPYVSPLAVGRAVRAVYSSGQGRGVLVAALAVLWRARRPLWSRFGSIQSHVL